MADGIKITLRRTVEQVVHCLVEAGSVLERGEDPRLALDDARQASDLLGGVVLPGISKLVLALPRDDEEP